jgi:hypothetical protein
VTAVSSGRLTESLDRVHAALDELARLRCGDPVAGRAVEAVRLTARTLEYFWLPTLGATSEDAGRSEPLDLRPPHQPRQA